MACGGEEFRSRERQRLYAIRYRYRNHTTYSLKPCTHSLGARKSYALCSNLMLVRSVGRASARFACSPLVLLRPIAYPVGAQVRAATSKAGGSTRNGRDSKPKYLGVKKFGGEAVKPGDIIIRQRGQR